MTNIGSTAVTAPAAESGATKVENEPPEDSESEDEEKKKLNPKIPIKAGIAPAEEVKAAAADAKKCPTSL